MLATAVVIELGIDAPAVVGNSLGGSTAAIFAITQPARAIVIVDQSLRPGDAAARIRPLEGRLRGDGFTDAMLEFEAGLGIDPLAGPARAELYAAVRSADRDVVLGAWAQLFSLTDEELNAAWPLRCRTSKHVASACTAPSRTRVTPSG